MTPGICAIWCLCRTLAMRGSSPSWSLCGTCWLQLQKLADSSQILWSPSIWSQVKWFSQGLWPTTSTTPRGCGQTVPNSKLIKPRKYDGKFGSCMGPVWLFMLVFLTGDFGEIEAKMHAWVFWDRMVQMSNILYVGLFQQTFRESEAARPCGEQLGKGAGSNQRFHTSAVAATIRNFLGHSPID